MTLFASSWCGALVFRSQVHLFIIQFMATPAIIIWWTIKYQYLYLHAFENGLALRRGVAEWIDRYNYDRGHSALDDKTPDEVYYGLPHPFEQAA